MSHAFSRANLSLRSGTSKELLTQYNSYRRFAAAAVPELPFEVSRPPKSVMVRYVAFRFAAFENEGDMRRKTIELLNIKYEFCFVACVGTRATLPGFRINLA